MEGALAPPPSPPPPPPTGRGSMQSVKRLANFVIWFLFLGGEMWPPALHGDVGRDGLPEKSRDRPIAVDRSRTRSAAAAGFCPVR